MFMRRPCSSQNSKAAPPCTTTPIIFRIESFPMRAATLSVSAATSLTEKLGTNLAPRLSSSLRHTSEIRRPEMILQWLDTVSIGLGDFLHLIQLAAPVNSRRVLDTIPTFKVTQSTHGTPLESLWPVYIFACPVDRWETRDVKLTDWIHRAVTPTNCWTPDSPNSAQTMFATT